MLRKMSVIKRPRTQPIDLELTNDFRQQEQHRLYGSTRRPPTNHMVETNDNATKSKYKVPPASIVEGRRRIDSDIPEMVRIFEAKRLAIKEMQKLKRMRIQNIYRDGGDEKKILKRLVKDYNESSLYDRHVEDEFSGIDHFKQAMRGKLPKSLDHEI